MYVSLNDLLSSYYSCTSIVFFLGLSCFHARCHHLASCCNNGFRHVVYLFFSLIDFFIFIFISAMTFDLRTCMISPSVPKSCIYSMVLRNALFRTDVTHFLNLQAQPHHPTLRVIEPFAPDVGLFNSFHHSVLFRLAFSICLTEAVSSRPSRRLMIVDKPELTPFRPPPGKDFSFFFKVLFEGTLRLSLFFTWIGVGAAAPMESPSSLPSVSTDDAFRFFDDDVTPGGGGNPLSHSFRCSLYTAIVALASVT